MIVDSLLQPLASMVAKKIRDISVRAPRKLVHIFHILQALNTRFSSDLPCSSPTFVEEYFTCPCKCISCGVRCCLSVNHTSNNVGHKAEYVGSNGVSASPCRYEPSLQNKLYFCKVSKKLLTKQIFWIPTDVATMRVLILCGSHVVHENVVYLLRISVQSIVK